MATILKFVREAKVSQYQTPLPKGGFGQSTEPARQKMSKAEWEKLRQWRLDMADIERSHLRARGW